jgi:tungstate transport system ATP-binding protein
VILYAIAHLTKAFGERTVLNIHHLEIESERIYALLGPNGAGKTTLLNMLGFLEPPTRGQIHFRGHPIRFSEPELQDLRRDVVVVDQHPILFTTTVYKNLEFGLKIRKIPRKEREQIIAESLDMVGMRVFSRAPAHNLSGGETQRVAIARALALSPAVLLCDEPTSSVDVENQNIIINILRQINEAKKITVLFTTHDRSQAARLSHQTLVLNRGRLVPTMYENIFRGILEHDSTGQPLCVIHNRLHLRLEPDQLNDHNNSVRVLIDPEKIDLVRPEYNNADSNGTTHGSVVQILQENGKIRVVVDAGVWIALLMPKDRYDEASPRVGDIVGLDIPPKAVRIF